MLDAQARQAEAQLSAMAQGAAVQSEKAARFDEGVFDVVKEGIRAETEREKAAMQLAAAYGTGGASALPSAISAAASSNGAKSDSSLRPKALRLGATTKRLTDVVGDQSGFGGAGATGTWERTIGDAAKEIWDDATGPHGALTAAGKCTKDVATSAATDLLKGKVPQPPTLLSLSKCALTTGWNIDDDTLSPDHVQAAQLHAIERDLRHGPPTVLSAAQLQFIQEIKSGNNPSGSPVEMPLDPLAGKTSIGPKNQ